MALVRLKTSGVNVRATVADFLSPERRVAAIRARAVGGLKESQEINRAALGRVPPHQTFVDGRQDEAMSGINPDRGVIVHRFDLVIDVLEWIEAQLILNSPIGKTPKSPEYSKSHIMFADGVEASPDAPPPAEVYVFLSTVPYARKIERGLSKQAPDGVYESVAVIANRRFGNIARVRFGYRAFQGGALHKGKAISEMRKTMGRREASRAAKRERDTRQPAIIVALH